MSNKQQAYRNTSISLPEVFDKVAKLDGTIEEKAAELLAYDNQHLRWFVDVMYNAPLGQIEIPKYIASSNPIGNHYASIGGSKAKIEAIIGDKNSHTTQKNLRLLLENLHADEAELVVNLLKGRKIEGISKAVFKKAYPVFFPVSLQTTLEETQED